MATPAAHQQSQSKPPAPRLALDKVVKGIIKEPYRIIGYGPEGVGKSTFAAAAPKPIFLGAEDGTAHLDVVRFPVPNGGVAWADIRDGVRILANEEHPYLTLVLDTLDWAEPLLWKFLCSRDGQESIEAYGYGKGYNAALDEWRVFVNDLEQLQRTKKMNVVLLAHSVIKTFKNPEGDDFDRYQLSINDKASGLFRQWARTVLFMNYETFAEKDKKTKRVKGVSTGARLIYTVRTAAYDAKNRENLPESLPLSWAEFESAATAGQDPARLREAIEQKAKKLGDELAKKTLASLEKAGNDAVKLAQLNDWVNAKTAEKES